jgi:hypothetical protein
MSAITERVAAGAAFLDEQWPGWWQRVALDQLDLGSCKRCILGQLSGDYDDGLTDLGFSDMDAVSFGFNTYIGFDALTREWKRVITERRSAS